MAVNTPAPLAHFLVRLNPPRPSFSADMDARERELMGRHLAYWRGLQARGLCPGFGPVLEPAGGWGLGLLAARDEAEARALAAADPVVAGGLLRAEIHPIRLVLPAADPEGAEAAVRGLYRDLLGAWNRRDATAMAALFAGDGISIGFDGSQAEGPEAIRAHLEPVFAHHPTAAYVAIVREVRFPGPGLALLRAVAGMIPPGAGDINPAVNAIQTLAAVREDGAWRVSQFQNSPGAFHGRPDLVEAMNAELRAESRAGEAGRGVTART